MHNQRHRKSIKFHIGGCHYYTTGHLQFKSRSGSRYQTITRHNDTTIYTINAPKVRKMNDEHSIFFPRNQPDLQFFFVLQLKEISKHQHIISTPYVNIVRVQILICYISVQIKSSDFIFINFILQVTQSNHINHMFRCTKVLDVGFRLVLTLVVPFTISLCSKFMHESRFIQYLVPLEIGHS